MRQKVDTKDERDHKRNISHETAGSELKINIALIWRNF